MKRVHVDGHRLAYYRVTESKTPHKTLHYAGFSAFLDYNMWDNASNYANLI